MFKVCIFRRCCSCCNGPQLRDAELTRRVRTAGFDYPSPSSETAPTAGPAAWHVCQTNAGAAEPAAGAECPLNVQTAESAASAECQINETAAVAAVGSEFSNALTDLEALLENSENSMEKDEQAATMNETSPLLSLIASPQPRDYGTKTTKYLTKSKSF